MTSEDPSLLVISEERIVASRPAPTFEHLFDLDADSLAADFEPERIKNLFIAHNLLGDRIDSESQSASKSYQPQNPQRVIHEGLERLQRRSNQLRPHILKPGCKILDSTRVQVIEQGIHSGISAKGVFLRGAKLHLWVATVLTVSLLAEVHEINIEIEQLDSGSLQMLRLVWVSSDLVQMAYVGVCDTVPLYGLGLLAKLAYLQGESLTGHDIDSGVNIVRLDIEELIPDPASSPS